MRDPNLRYAASWLAVGFFAASVTVAFFLASNRRNEGLRWQSLVIGALISFVLFLFTTPTDRSPYARYFIPPFLCLLLIAMFTRNAGRINPFRASVALIVALPFLVTAIMIAANH
jgi:hypothetical protein